MAFVGRLDDVPAPEILHFLAMSEKSGKLVLTRGVEEALVVFRKGRIIYAASSAIRETFGSIVSGLGLVSDSDLGEALHRQHHGHEGKRLGSILVEMGVLSRRDLEDAMREQVLRVMRDFFGWQRGYFTFRPLELDDRGEIEVDARDLVIDHPLDARQLTLDAARGRDELDRERAPRRARPTVSLDAIVSSLPSTRITAELVRDVIREARTAVTRVAVLAVQGPFANGISQSGLPSGGQPPSQRIRALRLPLDEPSMVASAVTRQRTWRGAPSVGRLDAVLLDRIGPPTPVEAVTIPMVHRDEVALVVYGDRGGETIDSERLAEVESRLRRLGERLLQPAGQEPGGPSGGLSSPAGTAGRTA